MTSDELLLLVGVPENYRLGGSALQKRHLAHPRVRVQIAHDLTAFAELVPQADATIGSRPYLRLPPPEDSPLWDLPNTIITPHIATETLQMSDAVVEFWCENVRRFADNEPLLGLMDRQAGY